MNCTKEDIANWKKEGKTVELLDIREFYETPEITDAHVKHLPMGDLLAHDFNAKTIYVLICGSGKRATAALRELVKHKTEVKLYSFKGGAEAYIA